MVRRPALRKAFLIAAMMSGVCGLPLLASGTIAIQAPPRHGTKPPEPRQEQAARVTLQGRVEDWDQSSKKLSGATLEFVKGPNTGRSTVADSGGFFSFSDLTPSVGGQAIRISHPGYRTGNFEPSIWSHRPVNQLNPRLMSLTRTPRSSTGSTGSTGATATATDSFRGSLSSTQPACDMPDRDYPCEKFRLSTSSGKTSLSAELTWTTSTDVDLDLILYDGSAAIARSVSSGTKKDVLNARISGSGPFDIRVISASGRGSASFTLAVKRTN